MNHDLKQNVDRDTNSVDEINENVSEEQRKAAIKEMEDMLLQEDDVD
jgi:hypothetical protein